MSDWTVDNRDWTGSWTGSLTPLDPVSHHAECWRDPKHHECAVARVEELEREKEEWRRVPEYAGYFGDPDTARAALVAREREAEDHHAEHHARERQLDAAIDEALRRIEEDASSRGGSEGMYVRKGMKIAARILRETTGRKEPT